MAFFATLYIEAGQGLVGGFFASSYVNCPVGRLESLAKSYWPWCQAANMSYGLGPEVVHGPTYLTPVVISRLCATGNSIGYLLFWEFCTMAHLTDASKRKCADVVLQDLCTIDQSMLK
jgi:hypothetical protein